MRLPHDEGVATGIRPESCVCTRKGMGEALTGDVRGGLLSREKVIKIRRSTFLANAGTTSAVATSASDRRLRRGRTPGWPGGSGQACRP